MTMGRFPFNVSWLAFVAAILLLPVLVRSNYVISVMILVAIYGVLAVGMGLLMGQAGLFSLAHPTWFGLGAYISAILSARDMLPPAAAIIASAIGVGVIAFLVGGPVLRLSGFYLACATFAIIIIAQVAAAQLTSLTGGPEGLLGIPGLSVGGFIFRTDFHFYYLSWGLCLSCYWFCSNLVDSRVGRAMRSFHDSELGSRSMGVNVTRYRLQIFVLTAVMASLSGSVFCYYLLFVVPDSFGFPLLVELLMMIIIGGIRSLRGALLGTFVVLWLTEFIHGYLGKLFPVMTSEVDAIFFGILIIVVLIFMPEGLTGWMDQLSGYGRKLYGRDAARRG
ncbi:MAG: branched-chain amino acid ABC transporter permease [Pseudomonadota bacterium]